MYREKYWTLNPLNIGYYYYICPKISWFKKIMIRLKGNKEFDQDFEIVLFVYEK